MGAKMITQAWRLDMRLKDRTMLRQYMDYMDFRTVRELATAAGVSHSTVGHLHSGKRSTCDAPGGLVGPVHFDVRLLPQSTPRMKHGFEP